MKTIMLPYSHTFVLHEARVLTDEEKERYVPECRDSMLLGTGHYIDLEYVHWTDMQDMPHILARKSWQFPSCSNVAHEITDEEWEYFVSLNASRKKEEEAKKRAEERAEYEDIIKTAEEQPDIPSREEARKILKAYNDVYNEGGEGWVPFIVTKELYEFAKEQLSQLSRIEEEEAK